MNTLYLIGRIVNDPDYRYTTDGKQVVRFRVAVGRRFKKAGDPDADFFNVVAFGKTTERLEKCFVGKGTKMLMTCELRNNNYTDKEGKKRYENEIIVNDFEFCEKRHGDKKAADPLDDNFVDLPDDMEGLLFK